MDTLPVELLTMIAVDSFDLFTTLLHVPTIGNRLCEQYPQLIAKEKFITVKIDDGNTRTYLNGVLHSFGDIPAIMYANGTKHWCLYGKHHRKDQPAIIYASGDKAWYWHNKRHRDGDQPAIEYANGDKHWYWYDKLHRKDLPACISKLTGNHWFWDNVLHRENDDLPALVERPDGSKMWYIHGQFIRKN